LKFLRQQGILDITILDSKIICLEDAKTPYIVWENYLDTLSDFELIVKTPGISPFHEKILPYKDKIISQAHIFFAEYTGKVIGITGTKGKSTLSTLLYECLNTAWYKTKLVGNIWSPVLDEIDIHKDVEYDYIVYELSSYMLQDFSPMLEIWILNNVYPCHLDWHYDSMSIYKEAKLNILKNAQNKIVNSELKEDPWVRALWSWKIFFSEETQYDYDQRGFLVRGEYIYTWDLALQGIHNKKNISWVVATLDTIIWDRRIIEDTLLQVLPIFWGLPHRIENIGIYEGITFINDAIATTPESTIAAIETFGEGLQTLFLGWEDSGFNFETLRARIVTSQIQNIIAFPDTSQQVFPEIEHRDYETPFEIDIEGKSIQFLKTRSMKSGVDFAFKTTLPGKISLLSCFAPRFSLWKSYTQKAEEFKKEVQSY